MLEHIWDFPFILPSREMSVCFIKLHSIALRQTPGEVSLLTTRSVAATLTTPFILYPPVRVLRLDTEAGTFYSLAFRALSVIRADCMTAHPSQKF